MLRRTIHPQVRVLDEKQGIVEYVASDESLDSYNEVVKADGARFNRFKKNAPFVDSHNYDSIDCLLGKVIKFGIEGKKVVEAVQWAIDVPTNELAQKGFQMTAAGYLRAVSIGFIPGSYVTKWDSNPTGFQDALKGLDLPAGTDVRTIYLEWEQLELSACVIGANENALARGYADGILDDSFINRISKKFPDFARKMQTAIKPGRRSYSFPATPRTADPVGEMLRVLGSKPTPTTAIAQPQMKTPNNTTDFSQLTGDSKRAFENIEFARRADNETEIERAVHRALAKVERERRHAYGNPVQRYLNDKPEMRFLWNGLARALGTGKLNVKSIGYELLKKAISGIVGQGDLGAALQLEIPIAEDLWDLLLQYGQYTDLGLRKMVGQYTNYPKVTGFPTAIFITPTQQGKATITPDTTLAGTQAGAFANTIAAAIQVSLAWLEDEKVDLSEIIVEKFIMGLAARIDWGCFQGNGNDDVTNGMCTGLFIDPNIGKYQTGIGVTQISKLQRSDFVNVTAQVSAAALQRMKVRPPRWYISPVLIPQLLLLTEGNGQRSLLKTPAETGGEWHLVGFPVTWAAQAPSVNGANSKVAVFGNPDSYLVSLHENFEFAWSSKGQDFSSLNASFRALTRGRSMMREATGFAALQLAPG